jgi:hypothetical protein
MNWLFVQNKTRDNNTCPEGFDLLLFGLSPKSNKLHTLCALCGSSEAGGEFRSKHL